VKPVLFSFCVLSVLSLTAFTAFPHGVSVFAWAEDDTIHGESSFSGGRQVKKAEIIVEDATSGKTFLTTVTDDKGQFSFPIPGEARALKSDLRIILQAGEAHLNEWTLEASDYLQENPEKQIVVKKNQGPTLPDILGGIGVIFGIAGIIAYYRARRKRDG